MKLPWEEHGKGNRQGAECGSDCLCNERSLFQPPQVGKVGTRDSWTLGTGHRGHFSLEWIVSLFPHVETFKVSKLVGHGRNSVRHSSWVLGTKLCGRFSIINMASGLQVIVVLFLLI